jgi:hypothetical protein
VPQFTEKNVQTTKSSYPFEEKYKILSSVMNGKFSSPAVLIEFFRGCLVPSAFTVTFHKSVPPREQAWMQNEVTLSLSIDGFPVEHY